MDATTCDRCGLAMPPPAAPPAPPSASAWFRALSRSDRKRLLSLLLELRALLEHGKRGPVDHAILQDLIDRLGDDPAAAETPAVAGSGSVTIDRGSGRPPIVLRWCHRCIEGAVQKWGSAQRARSRP